MRYLYLVGESLTDCGFDDSDDSRVGDHGLGHSDSGVIPVETPGALSEEIPDRVDERSIP